MGHYLYRLYNILGGLIYIGITNDLGTRLINHRSTAPWWAEAASLTVDAFPDRESLVEAEREAIQLEQPRYNQVHALPQNGAARSRWQSRFTIEPPENIEEFSEADWKRVNIASELKDWSNGYDGRTGCLLIHPEAFETIVNRIARLSSEMRTS